MSEFVIESFEPGENPGSFDDLADLILRGKLSPEDMHNYEGWFIARELGSSALAACVGYETRGSSVYMQSLVVDPAFRRQGLGKEITDTLYEQTVMPGNKLVALTLFWNNRFYQNIGFQRGNAKEIKTADDIGSKPKHRYCTAWVKEKPAS